MTENNPFSHKAPAQLPVPTKTSSLAKTQRTPRRQDGSAVHLCDPGVFARDIVPQVLVTYVEWLRRSSRENRVLTSSSTESQSRERIPVAFCPVSLCIRVSR